MSTSGCVRPKLGQTIDLVAGQHGKVCEIGEILISPVGQESLRPGVILNFYPEGGQTRSRGTAVHLHAETARELAEAILKAVGASQVDKS